ncbi:6-phosphogluconolactonase [Candidatus Kaiserbacteria bacterium]|nr:6-phosphogluconolactonase [Candidatus Kaiserbacteria bacterium]
MQLHTTDVPARELGETLTAAIQKHDGDVVVLLSGGSALDVIEHLDVPCGECRTPESTSSNKVTNQKICSLPECRTIFMMGDERGSREPEVNNTLQLKARYPEHAATKCLIETIPEETESLVNFATRIEKTFLEKIAALQNVKIFMILGMGPDGHTAGIFPLPERSFAEVYRDDLTYVPVHLEGLTIDSRASLTPAWILAHVDQIFGYVAGESKSMMLESLIHESKPLHERPAELMKLHKRADLFTDLDVT